MLKAGDNLIPYRLEKKIIEAISAAISSYPDIVGDQFTVSGSWQPSTGLPRWLAAESPSPVHVSVAVGTALPRTYTIGDVDFPVNVTLFVRTDLDVTGTFLLVFAGILENLFRSWQAETYQQAFEALDIPGGFAVGDVAGSQGSSPTVNGNLCSVSWPLVIGGSYLEPQSQIPNPQSPIPNP